MGFLRKLVKLTASGYSGWILYRVRRYLRSFAGLPLAAPRAAENLSASQIHSIMSEFNGAFRVSSSKAMCIHLYYTDVIQEILTSHFYLEEKCDLYISIGPQVTVEFFNRLKAFKGTVKIYQFENMGRDIFPFLKIYPDLANANYQWVCKLHSKRSPQIRDGELWRRDIISDLLSLQARSKLQTDRVPAIVAPQYGLLPVELFMGGNAPTMRKLLEDMGLERSNMDFLFISGSMFWFRPQSLKKLLNLKNVETYFTDAYRIDGNAEHAFERLFYFIAQESERTI